MSQKTLGSLCYSPFWYVKYGWLKQRQCGNWEGKKLTNISQECLTLTLTINDFIVTLILKTLENEPKIGFLFILKEIKASIKFVRTIYHYLTTTIGQANEIIPIKSVSKQYD